MSDPEQGDLLDLIANDPRLDPKYLQFLAACQNAARNGNRVYINDVRALMSNEYGLIVEPRTYSAFWSRAARRGGPLQRIHGEWAMSKDTRGRNSGKPQPVYRWVGGS
jgi:hypothetical protein